MSEDESTKIYGSNGTSKINDPYTRRAYERLTFDLTGYERALLDLICDHETDEAKDMAIHRLTQMGKRRTNKDPELRTGLARMLFTEALERHASNLTSTIVPLLPIADGLKDDDLDLQTETEYLISRVRIKHAAATADYLTKLTTTGYTHQIWMISDTVVRLLEIEPEHLTDELEAFLTMVERHSPQSFAKLSVDLIDHLSSEIHRIKQALSDDELSAQLHTMRQKLESIEYDS